MLSKHRMADAREHRKEQEIVVNEPLHSHTSDDCSLTMGLNSTTTAGKTYLL